MRLKGVLDGLDYTNVSGDIDKKVEGVACDSRLVKKGFIFLCINGEKSDGHKYCEQAISNGAETIIVEKGSSYELGDRAKKITVIEMVDTRKQMALISKNFYKEPSKNMSIVGITGTNGKTTVAYIISKIYEMFSLNVGTIGTIGTKINGNSIKFEQSTPTLPNSLELQQIFNEMRKKDVTEVVMEVTSIGLDLDRVEGMEFSIGVFTNLTEDHLDFHGSMEEYRKSKRKLFTQTKVDVINIDDQAGIEYIEFIKSITPKKPIITYSINNKEADIRAVNIEKTKLGTNFDIKMNDKLYAVQVKFSGNFNIYNVLASIAAAVQSGVPLSFVVSALETLESAPGRFETLKVHNGPMVVIDYAHTPDALENVLKTAKEYNPGKLVSVFGCGGDRDTTKRPLMGEISSRLADFTILTSDNPRSEDPKDIIKDIEAGIEKDTYKIELDRKSAIYKAIEMCEEEDVVVIAGKGHENYQIIGDKTVQFDDREMVMNFNKNI